MAGFRCKQFRFVMFASATFLAGKVLLGVNGGGQFGIALLDFRRRAKDTLFHKVPKHNNSLKFLTCGNPWL